MFQHTSPHSLHFLGEQSYSPIAHGKSLPKTTNKLPKYNFQSKEPSLSKNVPKTTKQKNTNRKKAFKDNTLDPFTSDSSLDTSLNLQFVDTRKKLRKNIPSWSASSDDNTLSPRIPQKRKGSKKQLDSSLDNSIPSNKRVLRSSLDDSILSNKRVLRSSTLHTSSNCNDTQSTTKPICNRNSRQRKKRTTPKKSLATSVAPPKRVSSRNRYQESKPNKNPHNRSKSSGADPKNKRQPTPQDTQPIKPKRGRPPTKKK